MKKLKHILTCILCAVISMSVIFSSSTSYALERSNTALYSDISDEEYLTQALSSLGSYKLSPVFGIDTNVCDMLSNMLVENGFEGIDISVKSVENTYTGGGIENDGTIIYFYDDPDAWRGFWGVTSKITFTLKYGSAKLESSPSSNVVILWDEDKVSDYMHKNVIDALNFSSISNENTSEDNVTSDLTLPQYYNDNHNVKITWESSDESAIEIISPSGSIDDIIYGAYTGKVKQGKSTKNITLTATFTFSKDSNIYEKKEFNITIPGTDASDTQDAMQSILDAYTLDKITLTSDGSSIGDGNEITSNLKLLSPSDLGIYDREYDIILSVNNKEDIEYINVPNVKNAAIAYVFRPLPDEGDKTVSFTVTLQSTVYSDISASKDFTVTIKALDNKELESKAENMEYVKSNFFDFIKGENLDKNNITNNLSSFYGIYKENGIFTAKSYIDKPNGSGIVSVCINPAAEADYRKYFQSSNTDIITDENLIVTRPQEDTTVTVTACLSDELYEAYLDNNYYPIKYAFDYSSKYQQSPFISSLYRQLVCAEVIVKSAEKKSNVKVTVMNGGAPVISGTELINQLVLSINDADDDGVLTVNDALILLHNSYCTDGYKTDTNNKITEFWGKEASNLKLYKNNILLNTPIKELLYTGDIITAVIDGSDYAYFDLNETYHLIGGDKVTLKLTDENGNPVIGAEIGEIDSTGAFTPFDNIKTDSDGYASFDFDTPGIRYVSAKSSSKTLTVPICIVNVVDTLIPTQTITISKSSASLEVGQTLKLSAEIYPEDATDKIIIWKSSNPSVASVNSDGTVIAKKSGRTSISAHCDSPSYEYATCVINVTENSSSSGGGSNNSLTASFKLTGLNKKTLIPSTKVHDLTEDNTVFDVFKMVLSENGFTYKGSGSYISSITTPDGETLSEYSYGKNSGWMYSVDGEIPSCSMDQYYLMGDDEILFFYTGDYTTVGGTTDYYTPSPSTGNSSAVPSPSPSPSPLPSDEENDEFRFDDINKEDWYYNDVYEAYEKNLFTGTSDTTFSPLSNLTRAMFVTVLYRLAGSPKCDGSYFSDVPANMWYSEAVAWAAQNKIVNGISDTEFAPQDNITREQIAVMLYNYAAPDNKNFAISDEFTDFSQVSNWAKDSVSWAIEQDIIKGRDNMTIDPKSPVTRAEAAAIIIRFINSK